MIFWLIYMIVPHGAITTTKNSNRSLSLFFLSFFFSLSFSPSCALRREFSHVHKKTSFSPLSPSCHLLLFLSLSLSSSSTMPLSPPLLSHMHKGEKNFFTPSPFFFFSLSLTHTHSPSLFSSTNTLLLLSSLCTR